MAYGMHQLDAATRRRGWLRAAAIGLLASVSSFFVLSALWKPAIGHSLVQGVIQYQPGTPPTPLDLDQVRAQMTSAAVLQEALQGAGESTDSVNVAAWQAQLSVHRAYSSAPAGTAPERIIVELPTRNEAAAIVVVQSIAQRFLSAMQASGGLATRGTLELAAARKAVTDALSQEDAARRILDELVHEQVERLQDVESGSEQDSGPALHAPQAAPRSENPAWATIKQRLGGLEQKRGDLLLTLTPAHPKVLDVDGEIEELQSRLGQTPRYLDSSDADRSLLAAARSSPDTALVEAARALAGEQGRMRTALDEYAAARATRLEAQAAVEVLERSTAEAPSKSARFMLAQSAQAIERYAAVPAPLRYLALLSLSALVLLAVTYSLRPRVVERLLKSAEDVADALRLPVIARLKLGGGKGV